MEAASYDLRKCVRELSKSRANNTVLPPFIRRMLNRIVKIKTTQFKQKLARDIPTEY